MSESLELATATSASLCDGASTDSPGHQAAEESSSQRPATLRPLLGTAQHTPPPSDHSDSSDTPTNTIQTQQTQPEPQKQPAESVLVRVQPYASEAEKPEARRVFSGSTASAADDDSSDSDDDGPDAAASSTHRRLKSEPFFSEDHPASSLRETLTALRRFVTFQSTLEPHARAKVTWDWFMILLALYSFFFTCWIIAFDEGLGGTLEGFDGFVTACFLLDIVITFRTAFVDHSGNAIFDPKLIAERYAKSMLAVDLVAALPFHVLSPAISFGEGASHQFVDNCLKCNFILRASKLLTSQRIDAFISPQARILKLIFSFFLLAHLFASIFWFVAVIETTDRTWISAAALENKSHAEQYVASLYWALATMTTVGYGDIVPQTVYEQATVIPILMLSALIYATIFGSMAYSMETITATMRRYQSRIDSVREFAAVYELPPELQRKLEDYTNVQFAQTKGFETSVMLGHLPTSVKAEILLYVNRSLIERVPLFKQCSDRFTEALILRMTSQVCLAGDYLFKESDKSSDMFFIREGRLAVIMDIQGTPTKIAEIAEHSLEPFIGEISLLLGEPRTASVRASTKCVLSKLSQSDFFEVMQAFPEEENSLRETATARLEQDIEREARALKAKEAKKARGGMQRAGSIVGNQTATAAAAAAPPAAHSTPHTTTVSLSSASTSRSGPAHPFALSDPSSTLVPPDPIVASAVASRTTTQANASLLSRSDKLTKMNSTAVRNSVFGSLGQPTGGNNTSGGGGGNSDSDSIISAQANNRKRMSVTTGQLLRSASFTTSSLSQSNAAATNAPAPSSSASPGPFTHIAEETEDEAAAPNSPSGTQAQGRAVALAGALAAQSPATPPAVTPSSTGVPTPAYVSPTGGRHARTPTLGDRYAITLSSPTAAAGSSAASSVGASRKHTSSTSSMLLPPGAHAPTPSASGMDALLELRRTAVHARQRTGMASLGSVQPPPTPQPQPPTPMHASSASASAASPPSPAGSASTRESLLESKLAALTAQLEALTNTVGAMQANNSGSAR